MAPDLTPFSTSSSSLVLAIFLGCGTTAGVPGFLVGAKVLFCPLTLDWGSDDVVLGWSCHCLQTVVFLSVAAAAVDS